MRALLFVTVYYNTYCNCFLESSVVCEMETERGRDGERERQREGEGWDMSEAGGDKERLRESEGERQGESSELV